MSRVGKQPIPVPAGVTVSVDARCVTIKGPKGELSWSHPEAIDVSVDGDQVAVSRSDDEKQSRAFHGLTRSLVANMVTGVHEGFQKILELEGVGFRASLEGRVITMLLGYSHPIVFDPPPGIEITCPNPTTIVIDGPDKQLVGQVAARLRAFYPAEPYKGKGVRYRGEQVRRKAGKTVA